MKYEMVLFALLASSVSYAADSRPELTGILTRAQVEEPRYPWMDQGLEKHRSKYKKRPITLRQIARNLPGTEVEIYFGSWCSDSHDHVPPFLALMDEVKSLTATEPASVKFIALDKKKSHRDFKNDRNIDRLPTFVFLRNGAEIGRIVESPKKSIAEDTLQIITPKTTATTDTKK